MTNQENNTHKTSWPIDLSIEWNDKLSHWWKVTAIKEFIEEKYSDWWDLADSDHDKMIALYGWRWSGKSSIMYTLCQWKESNHHIDKENYTCLFFEAWKYEKDKDLTLSLFHFICKELNNKIKWIQKNNYIKKVRNKLNALIWASKIRINTNSTIPDQNWNIHEVWLGLNFDGQKYIKIYNQLKNKSENGIQISKESIFTKENSLRENFWELISKKSRKKLIIFIDDLDRCESENIINLLSSIKLFFTYMPNTVFVVWIDKDAVVKWLQAKYNNDSEKAEEYLEKLFTNSFNVNKNPAILELVESFGREKEISKEVADMFEVIEFTNPRHVKRLINKYSHLEKKITSEISDLNNLDIGKWKGSLLVFLFLMYLYEFKNDEFYNLNWNREIWNWREVKIIQHDNISDITEEIFKIWVKSSILIQIFLWNINQWKDIHVFDDMFHKDWDMRKISSIIESLKNKAHYKKVYIFLLFFIRKHDQEIYNLIRTDKMKETIENYF